MLNEVTQRKSFSIIGRTRISLFSSLAYQMWFIYFENLVEKKKRKKKKKSKTVSTVLHHVKGTYIFLFSSSKFFIRLYLTWKKSSYILRFFGVNNFFFFCSAFQKTWTFNNLSFKILSTTIKKKKKKVSPNQTLRFFFLDRVPETSWYPSSRSVLYIRITRACKINVSFVTQSLYAHTRRRANFTSSAPTPRALRVFFCIGNSLKGCKDGDKRKRRGWLTTTKLRCLHYLRRASRSSSLSRICNIMHLCLQKSKLFFFFYE